MKKTKKNKKWGKQMSTNMMIYFKPILIIILTINRLKSPNKTQRVLDWIKRPNYMLSVINFKYITIFLSADQ